MKIYIIRHGETKFNEEGKLQGWIDEKLNGSGELLARLTGEGLKGVKFDICYSSSLTRAKKTAELLLKESGNDCPIIIDDRIKELHMGDYQGKCFKGENIDPEINLDIVNAYFTNPLKMGVDRIPGGESIFEFMDMTQEFLKEIAKKDYETVLVSTHGCALRAMLNFLYEDKEDFWHGHVPYNCSISVVEVKNGEMKLIEDDRIYYDKKYLVDRYSMK